MRELGTGYREAVDTKRVQEALGAFQLRDKTNKSRKKNGRAHFY
jgi:hypothetical protein